jgi:hypothetical protein
MRRTTITILAVTLSATAATACGGASETVSQPSKQTLAGEPTGEPSDTTAAGEKATSPAEPAPESKPTTSDQQDPAAEPTCDMTALRDELAAITLEGALQQHERFRCLCDDQGYPLVGNINSKGTTPSAVCASLKEKGLL